MLRETGAEYTFDGSTRATGSAGSQARTQRTRRTDPGTRACPPLLLRPVRVRVGTRNEHGPRVDLSE